MSSILEDLQTVPVHVTNAHDLTAPAARPRDVEVNCNTYFLSSAATSELFHRILDRDPNRIQALVVVASGKAYVCHSSAQAEAATKDATTVTTAAGSPASTTTEGSQTTPGAGTTITSQALAAGTYTVAWSVELGGTLAAADANNFQLTNGASQVAVSLNPAVAGTYPQPAETVVIAAGGATLAIKNIALATTGAVYTAQLTVTPVPAGAVTSPAATPQDGFILAAGVALPPLKTTDPVWVACPTDQAATGILVSVIAERRRA